MKFGREKDDGDDDDDDDNDADDDIHDDIHDDDDDDYVNEGNIYDVFSPLSLPLHCLSSSLLLLPLLLGFVRLCRNHARVLTGVALLPFPLCPAIDETTANKQTNKQS